MPAPVCLAILAAVGAYQEPAPPSEDAPDEIVVTGERARRTIHDTSSSVTVVSQADIEANGANDDQALSLIPNVQLGNGSQGPAIRALDSRSSTSEGFGSPVKLPAPVNARPNISKSGAFVTFSSNRTGSTSPAADIWFATREKITGK